MDTDDLTRAALSARSGDRAAAGAFIRGSQADVWRLCAHLAGRAQADDLTQETYLRAFGALSSFAGRSSARTWLLSIARRVVVDHFRAAAARPSTEPTADIGGEHDVVPGVDDGMTLRELVRGLDLDRREAFVLTQVCGLSYAEAARLCGCPVGTIRSRVARARDELMRALQADDPRSASSSRSSVSSSRRSSRSVSQPR